MGKERRRSPRVRQRAECEIHLGKKVHAATLLDISEGGVAAVCVEELPVGSSGTISFRALGKPVEIKALVWHCRQVRFRGDAAFAYGFMLEDASDAFHGLLPAGDARSSKADAQTGAPSAPAERQAPGAGPRAKVQNASAAAPKEGPRKIPRAAVRAAQTDGPKGKRLAHLRAELDDSLRENRSETQGTSFRVRAKMRTQPRTKTLTLSVSSEAEAREAVEKQLGADWEILEIAAA